MCLISNLGWEYKNKLHWLDFNSTHFGRNSYWYYAMKKLKPKVMLSFWQTKLKSALKSLSTIWVWFTFKVRVWNWSVAWLAKPFNHKSLGQPSKDYMIETQNSHKLVIFYKTLKSWRFPTKKLETCGRRRETPEQIRNRLHQTFPVSNHLRFESFGRYQFYNVFINVSKTSLTTRHHYNWKEKVFID